MCHAGVMVRVASQCQFSTTATPLHCPSPSLPLHASSKAQGACSDTLPLPLPLPLHAPLAHLQNTRAAPAPAQRTPRRAGLTQGRGRPGTPPGCRPASGLTHSRWAQGAWTQHSRHAATAAAAAGAGEGARMRSERQDDAARQAAVKGGCRPRQQHRAIAGGCGCWVHSTPILLAVMRCAHGCDTSRT